MNAVEVSNILWGLSRVNFVHHNLVDQLMARLTSKEVEVSPKEAAMALYARNVNLRPPQQLLNLWAVQKLGLASARSIDLGV